jgi:hypothetical protein
MSALSLINLERYPIDGHDEAAYAAVVASARAQLAASGYAELPDFVTASAVRDLVADADALAPRAHPSQGPGTAYLELPDDAWPDEHPRKKWMDYSVRAVGYDLIPYSSPLRRIYELPQLDSFVSEVLGRGPLFHYADPCGALNLAVMGEGDQLQWHFDQTDFVVSLAIQDAEQGGDFEVVPLTRSSASENYDEVQAILDGDQSRVLRLAMTPGTLLIFEGRYSLHRVSPISGDRWRHVGLLAYDTKPDTVSSELLRAIRYGRTDTFDTPPTTWPVA